MWLKKKKEIFFMVSINEEEGIWNYGIDLVVIVSVMK